MNLKRSSVRKNAACLQNPISRTPLNAFVPFARLQPHPTTTSSCETGAQRTTWVLNSRRGCNPINFGASLVVLGTVEPLTRSLRGHARSGSTPRTGGWMAIAHPRPRRINGWRATQDPVQLVVYVIDEHKTKPLNGAGPWICFAFHFPHSGPGGSLSVNKHRRSGEEE